MWLRLKDQGHESLSGIRGDLILQLTIEDDKRYRRQGFDIHSDLDITFTQAALGCQAEIETIYGKKPIPISPGTQHNQSLTIKGAGLTILNNNQKAGGKQAANSENNKEQKGDHVITFKVVIPK